MAFKLTHKPTFPARVKVEMPNQKGGVDRFEFQVVFKRVTMDEVEELKHMKPIEVLNRTVTGWIELVTDENQPIDFNDENLHALLQIPQAVAGMTEAFWTSQFKAKEKN